MIWTETNEQGLKGRQNRETEEDGEREREREIEK
jgi:hypothetical protein